MNLVFTIWPRVTCHVRRKHLLLFNAAILLDTSSCRIVFFVHEIDNRFSVGMLWSIGETVDKSGIESSGDNKKNFLFDFGSTKIFLLAIDQHATHVVLRRYDILKINKTPVGRLIFN